MWYYCLGRIKERRKSSELSLTTLPIRYTTKRGNSDIIQYISGIVKNPAEPITIEDIKISMKNIEPSDFRTEKCPKCNSLTEWRKAGGYFRWVINQQEGKLQKERVYTKQFKCSKCNSKHACIPVELIIPYKGHCLQFISSVLASPIKRKQTISKVCEEAAIAIDTYYKWKQAFLCHFNMILQAIEQHPEIDEEVCDIALSNNIQEHAKKFFQTYGRPFMMERIVRKRDKTTLYSAP